MPCSDVVCGTGGWTGPLPGDPDNNSVLSAVGSYGGVDVSWTYPTTNPHALMHTKLYRGLSSNFGLAVEHRIVAGNFFFDAIPDNEVQPYFYWIKFVSVNGTEGNLIGPASATPFSNISGIIEQLTGEIDVGYLAQTLRSDIEYIHAVDVKLVQETLDRLASELLVAGTIDGVQLDLQTYLSLLQTETSTRANNVASLIDSLNQEANTRAHDINQEATQRVDIVNENAEAVLRAALLIHAELIERADDIALARQELTESFQAGISAEAALRLELLAKTSTDTTDTRALITAESVARTDAVSAEASQRDLLAAQLRGNYAGADANQVTQGLFYQEQQARVQLGYALSEQITLLSAGQAEQFDWNSIWYFDESVEGWTGNGSPVATSGWLRPADHATDPYIISPAGLTVAAAKYNQLRLRIRKTGTPTFSGFLWWKTTGQPDWLEAQKLVITAPTFDGNGIALITLNPAWAGTVIQVKLVLSAAQTASNYFTVDWVAIGRPSPGASSSKLLELERVTVDTANTESLASKVTTLTSTVNNPVSGLAATNSLISNDYYTKSAANAATASAQNVLITEFGNHASKVFRQGTAPAQGFDTVTLADGTFTQVAYIKAGDYWLNSADGNKPHVFDGLVWVYTPDTSTAATEAYVDKFEEVISTGDGATVTAWRDAVASVSGLSAAYGQISELQEIVALVADSSVTVSQSKTQVAATNALAEAVLTDLLNSHNTDIVQRTTLAAHQETINTKVEEGRSALAEQKEFLIAKVDTVAGQLEQINTITADSGSVTGRTLFRLEGQIDNPVTGLSQAHAHIADINNISVGSTSAAASNLANLMAVVNDATTGLLKAHADITEINDVSATSDSALAKAVSVISTRFAGFTEGETIGSHVTDYTYSKSEADGAIASKATFLQANIDSAVSTVDARVSNLETTKIGYSSKGGIPFDNGGLIIDKAGVDAWNIANPTNLAVWQQGIPFASAVKQVSVTTASGSTIGIEQRFQTVEDLGATYTAKLTSGDLIGGFGVHNNGAFVEAGFDVDRFWVGRTTNKVKPFIIDNGTVYIDKARIRNADIDTLKVAGNSVTSSSYLQTSCGVISATSSAATQWTSAPMVFSFLVSAPQSIIFIVSTTASTSGGSTNVGIRLRRSDGIIVLDRVYAGKDGFTQEFSACAADYTAPAGTYYYSLEAYNSWNNGYWAGNVISIVALATLR